MKLTYEIRKRQPRCVECLDSKPLYGLTERHGWSVGPAWNSVAETQPLDGGYEVGRTWPPSCDHSAPTLIEALTEASRCPRCTGKQES